MGQEPGEEVDAKMILDSTAPVPDALVAGQKELLNLWMQRYREGNENPLFDITNKLTWCNGMFFLVSPHIYWINVHRTPPTIKK